MARDGPNELPVSQPHNLLRQVRELGPEPMFLLLLAFSGVYIALSDTHEALMLLAFVLVAVSIRFDQQRRTERSLAALRDILSPRALFLCDGRAVRIAGREPVKEDIVLLAEGDRTPADLQLLGSSNTTIGELMLTGESIWIEVSPQIRTVGKVET